MLLRIAKIFLAIALSFSFTFSLWKIVMCAHDKYFHEIESVNNWLDQNNLGQYKTLFREIGELMSIRYIFLISPILGTNSGVTIVSKTFTRESETKIGSPFVATPIQLFNRKQFITCVYRITWAIYYRGNYAIYNSKIKFFRFKLLFLHMQSDTTFEDNFAFRIGNDPTG